MRLSTEQKQGKTGEKATIISGAPQLLQLFIAQLEDAQQENNQAIERLGNLFESLATEISANPPTSDSRELMQQYLYEIIGCLQSHDKLNQRLDHVRGGLELLTTNLRQRSKPVAKWTKLAAGVSGSYTMESEHRVHRRMFGSDNREDAAPSAMDGNIEIF